jgi:uncharacterized membrane protein
MMAQRRGSSQKVTSDQTPLPPLNEQLPEEFKAILKKLNPQEQITIKSVAFGHFQAHSGPLPTPESLEKYNGIIPNGAERIMNMAEVQASHRIEIEKVVVLNQVKQSSRGQIFGFIIALVGLASSIFLAMNGFQLVATTIGGTTVIGLVTVFVYGKRSQKQELENKKPR